MAGSCVTTMSFVSSGAFVATLTSFSYSLSRCNKESPFQMEKRASL